ncbi:M24 family metallopeptidase [Salinimonas lutimaris]|uniref:M24 family metallopeptidase n=1 Tax=Salinimonas lutimaris TaxID=914153 RepID=UPI0010C0D8B1|nr:Xaa-Pro peptidase family protein [Salinimonas lutimaris]
MDKRAFLKISAAGAGALAAGRALAAQSNDKKPFYTDSKLADITGSVSAISPQERKQRIAKAQQLMQLYNMAAIILEPGAAMDYFTGIQWWRSERLTCVVIPKEGEIAIVTPFFEAPSVRETLTVGEDIRVWQEHESPFAQVQQILRDRKLTKGKLGFEQSVRYFVVNGLMPLLPDMHNVSAEPVTLGCRMIKSAHEIALIHKANDVTLRAYGHVYERLEAGMSQADVKALMHNAQQALGGDGIWTMALFDKASAYPHGTRQEQVLKEGSVVLMDCGCAVHGYQSDISRTFLFGEPGKKQRKVWQQVRQGQQVAFEHARLNQTAGSVDDAVRKLYQSFGYGPDYALPGLSHRTGHGIGMEGHEKVNFVRGEDTRLQAGMCFSNEPGIYLPGEFGVRLEDCMYMTDDGPAWFTEPPESIDAPLGKLAELKV